MLLLADLIMSLVADLVQRAVTYHAYCDIFDIDNLCRSTLLYDRH